MCNIFVPHNLKYKSIKSSNYEIVTMSPKKENSIDMIHICFFPDHVFWVKVRAKNERGQNYLRYYRAPAFYKEVWTDSGQTHKSFIFLKCC